MSNFFETPIEFLKGIGPTKADVLKKELGIFTFQDLMFHYPFRYIDRTKYYQIKEVTPELPFIQFVGKLINKQVVGERQGKRLVAQFEDATGMIECVWFQSLKWADKSLIIGTSYVVFGKTSGTAVSLTDLQLGGAGGFTLFTPSCSLATRATCVLPAAAQLLLLLLLLYHHHHPPSGN